jgi:hypothetical protein
MILAFNPNTFRSDISQYPRRPSGTCTWPRCLAYSQVISTIIDTHLRPQHHFPTRIGDRSIPRETRLVALRLWCVHPMIFTALEPRLSQTFFSVTALLPFSPVTLPSSSYSNPSTLSAPFPASSLARNSDPPSPPLPCPFLSPNSHHIPQPFTPSQPNHFSPQFTRPCYTSQ